MRQYTNSELLGHSIEQNWNVFSLKRNSYVFSDFFLRVPLFNELENYYIRGKVYLAEAMDSFFNTLYQKMFTVLSSQYKFDDK